MSRPTREGAAARALYARIDARATGKLTVGAGAAEVAVHVLNGEIVGATSVDDLRQIIRLLVASKAIEAAAADGYEALVDEGGDAFGALLVLGPTFDKALSERFRQNLSDYLSSVSAPRFFEQKTVFVENLQMGHDARSLIDEVCAVCDLARAVDVDHLVVRGPVEPGPDPLRQLIASLVGTEPRTISSLLHEIPAEPVRSRVIIGSMLQSRELTPPGLLSVPPPPPPGLVSASPKKPERKDPGSDDGEFDLLAVPFEDDEPVAQKSERTRPLPRAAPTAAPPPERPAPAAPPSPAPLSSSTPVPARPRTPGPAPTRDATPSQAPTSPPTLGQGAPPKVTQGRSRAKQVTLPAAQRAPAREAKPEPPRPETQRSEPLRPEALRPESPPPEPPRHEAVRVEPRRMEPNPDRRAPFEGSAEFTRAIPDLGDFEIRTEDRPVDPELFEPSFLEEFASTRSFASREIPSVLTSRPMSAPPPEPVRSEPVRSEPVRSEPVPPVRSEPVPPVRSEPVPPVRSEPVPPVRPPSVPSPRPNERRGKPTPSIAPPALSFTSAFHPQGDDEDVEDARTEQVDRRMFSTGSMSDWLNRTDTSLDEDLFSDHDYDARGGDSDGRFRTDSRHLDRVEVGGMGEDRTGEAGRRLPAPEDVIEADEASLDLSAVGDGSSSGLDITARGPRMSAVEEPDAAALVKFGAPALTQGDALAKVEVANEVLSIIGQALDEARGQGSGPAAIQLLVDGAPSVYAAVLHDLVIDESSELPPERVLRNLQGRPATEHRQLLNNCLADLIERALESAVDTLPEDVFDEVLGSVAGYRQRLGL